MNNHLHLKWSSAIDHVNEREEKHPITLKKHKGIEDVEWKEYLRENDADMTEEIRLKTNRGLVLSTDAFIKRVEGILIPL